MKKRLITSIIILLWIILITGCGKTEKVVDDTNKNFVWEVTKKDTAVDGIDNLYTVVEIDVNNKSGNNLDISELKFCIYSTDGNELACTTTYDSSVDMTGLARHDYKALPTLIKGKANVTGCLAFITGSTNIGEVKIVNQ